MNYFTPELLARFASTDGRVADAASEEWERNQEKYLERLDAIRSKLPEGARTFLDNCCLHDARVLWVDPGKKGLSIFLQLDSPRDRGVKLDYEFASRPEFIRHHQPSGKEPPLWLYDELDMREENGRPVFTHSILFTEGGELRITFSNMEVQGYRKVSSPQAEDDSGCEMGELLACVS